MVGFDKFQDLLYQEVSRKEFLRYIGIALLSVIGVASMIQNLSGTINSPTQNNNQTSGYGTSVYGR
jgi:hypothetical protein